MGPGFTFKQGVLTFLKCLTKETTLFPKSGKSSFPITVFLSTYQTVYLPQARTVNNRLEHLIHTAFT
jgi:hypothetical protein